MRKAGGEGKMSQKKIIAISGMSGFIGSQLSHVLRKAGYEVWPMVRHLSRDPHEIFYDYEKKKIDLEKLEKCYAMIHLAGKNIMAGLWTKSFKKELYDSRVKSTRMISHQLAQLSSGPKILLNASAIGIYGDRSDQKIDEDIAPGKGFLAKLVVDWERGTLFAKRAGIRVVNMRFAPVLDVDGGMLKSLLPIFKMGLGGPLGSGEQYMSYVTRPELIKEILFLLENEDISGPINMTALEPTTNKEFANALASVLKRPTFIHTPAFLLKLLGDQGKMFLASLRVYPKALLDHGFKFDHHHDIKAMLEKILKK
jgi:uncharacterized protein